MAQAKKKSAGRPTGKQHRPRIDLPDGEQLWPLYDDWCPALGLNQRSVRRIRGLDTVTVFLTGTRYIKNNAGRRLLAEPRKRGARR